MKKIKLKEKFTFFHKNVKIQKTDEGEKFTVNVTPQNYPIFIKLFPLKYNVVFFEKSYDEYLKGKVRINIFKPEIFVDGEGSRKYIYFQDYEPKDSFYFFHGVGIFEARVQPKKINLKKNMKL